MMLKTIFSVCLPIQSYRGVVSCVIAPEAMVLPSITFTGTWVDFLTIGMLCWAINVWSMKEEVASESTNADTYGMSSGIQMMSTY
jgi:hypothetical protein